MNIKIVSRVFLTFLLCGFIVGAKHGSHSPANSRHQSNSQKKAAPPQNEEEEEESIEDVDEDKIDEIVEDGDQNLVIIFYDARNRCPTCAASLRELEEIDDDLENAHIEVVKTDDKNVARELGVHTFPALVFYRRKNPILYDGDFSDSEVVLRWVRSHEEVATADLTDNDFEDRTDTASPNEGALDWFVMFYNEKDAECNSHIAVWETVAHKLRGLVNVGKVDIDENDDVAQRFKVDEDDDCPTFLLFHRARMYRYKGSARDVKSFLNFAMHKFKEQRGHKVPDPPTLLEEIYEDIKEELEDMVEDGNIVMMSVLGGVGAIVFGLIVFWCLKAFRSKKSAKQE